MLKRHAGRVICVLSVLNTFSCGSVDEPRSLDPGIAEPPAQTNFVQQGVFDGTFGTWENKNNAPVEAIHATLVHRQGFTQIYVVGGSQYNCCFTWGRGNTYLYDVNTDTWWGSQTASPYPSDKDPFCGGQAHDAFGNPVHIGGLLGYFNLNGKGISNGAFYNLTNDTFVTMNGVHARWYPTVVPTAASWGSMYVLGGNDENGAQVTTIEQLGGLGWTNTNMNITTVGTYPRAFLMHDGREFVATPKASASPNRVSQYINTNNTVTNAGTAQVPDEVSAYTNGDGSHDHLHDGNFRDAVVFEPITPFPGYDSIALMVGGPKAWERHVADPNSTWVATAARPSTTERKFVSATILPTGQVFVSGGVQNQDNDADPVNTPNLTPEVYGVDQGNTFGLTWFGTTATTITRTYHSVALLLPDGRVWVASSNKNNAGSQCGSNCTGGDNRELSVQTFKPWYIGAAGRPVISSCPANLPATPGDTFSISLGSNDGLSIDRVSLMRAGSVTHGQNSDQRLIFLQITAATASSLTLRSPTTWAAAPPGDYMLFVLKNVGATARRIPSVACWMRKPVVN